MADGGITVKREQEKKLQLSITVNLRGWWEAENMLGMYSCQICVGGTRASLGLRLSRWTFTAQSLPKYQIRVTINKIRQTVKTFMSRIVVGNFVFAPPETGCGLDRNSVKVSGCA